MKDERYANAGERIAAFLIDAAIIAIPSYLVSTMFANSFKTFSLGKNLDEFSAELGGQLWGRLAGIAVVWIYYAAMESSEYQATVGKMLVGLRVVDENLGRPSFARASGRYFGRFVSVISLGIGLVIQPFMPRKQTLHDIMAGCLVVRRSKLCPDRSLSDSEQGQLQPEVQLMQRLEEHMYQTKRLLLLAVVVISATLVFCAYLIAHQLQQLPVESAKWRQSQYVQTSDFIFPDRTIRVVPEDKFKVALELKAQRLENDSEYEALARRQRAIEDFRKEHGLPTH